VKRLSLSSAQMKVWSIAFVAIATLFAGVTLQILRDRSSVIEAAEDSTQQLALTLEASVKGVVQSAELVADNVGSVTLNALTADGNPSDLSVQRWYDILTERPFINSITFIRPDGRIPVSVVRRDGVQPSLYDAPLDVSAWAPFAVHRGRSDRDLFIAPPHVSVFSDLRIVPLTRPLRTPDDALLGVVYVDTALSTFLDLFSEVLPEGNNAVVLFHDDGRLLFSYPFRQDSVDQSFSNAQLFQSHLPENQFGTYQAPSRTIGDVRILSYRSVDGWPLVLAVDHSLDGVLAPWRDRSRTSILVVLAASLIIITLTFWISRQIHREEVSRKTLLLRERSLEESQRLAGIGHFERDILSDAFVWADNMYKIHGVSPDTFTPSRQTFLDLVVNDARGAVRNRVNHYDSPPQSGHLEARILRPSDGQIRDIVYAWKVIRDENGVAVKSFGVAQDVTNARHNEITLRESEARLRDITECISDFIWETNAANELAVFDTGNNNPDFDVPERDLGRGFVDTREGEGDRSVVRQAIARRDPFRNLTLPVRNKNGSISWLRISGNPRFGADGEFLGFRGAGTDVTEQHNKRIVELERSKSDALARLAGGMAHEINNLLQPVIVYSSMGETEDPKISQAQGYFGKIYSASQQAVRIVQDVLTFAREGRRVPNAVDLNSALQEGLDIIGPTLPPAIALSGPDSPADIAVAANQGGLHQVLINLVRNSADALGDTGTISISTGTVVLYPSDADRRSILPGRYGYFTVADDGPGLEQDTADKIFDPFFSTKAMGRGTGLGLSVVAGLVREWGGSIDVTSRPGETVFTVYIPYAESARQAAE